jgi:hypothetical protein
MAVLLTTLLVLFVVSDHLANISVFAEEATITTFTGATVERLDPANHQLTFRTLQGQSWSLQVTDATLLKGLNPGDRVSLELNAEDRVKNIVRDKPESEPKPESGSRQTEY